MQRGAIITRGLGNKGLLSTRGLGGQGIVVVDIIVPTRPRQTTHGGSGRRDERPSQLKHLFINVMLVELNGEQLRFPKEGKSSMTYMMDEKLRVTSMLASVKRRTKKFAITINRK